MKITVYTTSTCPFCDMLKNFLREKGIEFEEKRVDGDKDIRGELEKVSGGFLGVPFTVVETQKATEQIIGFDKARLETVLNS